MTHTDPQRRETRRSRQYDAPDAEDFSDALKEAVRGLTGGAEPSVPSVSTVRDLKRVASPPYHHGEVTINSLTVTDGDPQHGAMMSGAHVSGVTARFPRECPECPAGVAVFDYNRHHNIAGSVSLRCECGHVHHRDDF